MASFNKFQPFVEALAEGLHDLGADTLKVALTNTAPDATDDHLADITQITYNTSTAGPETATQSSSAQTSGTYKLVVGDVTFTATSSTGPFRYAVLYNDTASNDELIGYWDYGSSITLATSETFTVDFSAANGVLTLA